MTPAVPAPSSAWPGQPGQREWRGRRPSALGSAICLWIPGRTEAGQLGFPRTRSCPVRPGLLLLDPGSTPGVSEPGGVSRPGGMTEASQDAAERRRRWSRRSVPERLERMELRYRGRTRNAAQPGQRPEPSLPAGTDMLPQIKHIVVLMMENHSYDNYLGMLAGRGEGFPLDGDGGPAVTNLDAEGSPVRAHHLTTTKQTANVPCQSWHASQLQWNQGKMDGFVTSTQDVAPDADPAVGMGYWTADDLPFYNGLARTFPLADHWFSSVPGADLPQPPVPHRRNGQRTGRRPAVPSARLPAERHHLRHADQARHPVGELPSGERGQVQGAAGGALPAPPGPPHADRHGPGRAQGHRRGSEGHTVHRRPVPARHRPAHAAYPRHGPVLRRCRRRHAARLQPRGSGVRRVLRGEPAGHPEGGELRRRGDQPGHARQGLAGHPADLDL